MRNVIYCFYTRRSEHVCGKKVCFVQWHLWKMEQLITLLLQSRNSWYRHSRRTKSLAGLSSIHGLLVSDIASGYWDIYNPRFIDPVHPIRRNWKNKIRGEVPCIHPFLLHPTVEWCLTHLQCVIPCFQFPLRLL